MTTKNRQKKIDHLKKEKLKEIYIYYKNFYFETKKENIDLLENIINNRNDDGNYKKFLNDYELAKKMNLVLPIIKYLLKENYKKETEITESLLKKVVMEWEIISKIIADKKIKKMKRSLRQLLFKYFDCSRTKMLFLKIFTKDVYDFFFKIKEAENKAPHKC